jgi:hypothetical protein
MSFSFGEHIDGLTVGGKELQAGVFNENEVRAAAGITLVVAAIAFSLAYFRHQYVPLQAASSFFFVEFLIRTTAGIRYSPIGVLARWMTLRQPPEWVSAKPKRFAWTLGLAMAFSMTIITNSGIRGTLPRTLCIICMTMMWLESALGICLGCELHALLMRRGLTDKDPEIELCSHGVCELPARPAGATTTTTAG